MPLPEACLIDVYDTILLSQFATRMTALVEPLGVPVAEWLAAWEKLRAERDHGRLTVAASFTATLPEFGIEPTPGLLSGLLRRDTEWRRAHVLLCPDTVPFLEWLRSRGVRSALVSNCEDTTRGQLAHLGLLPLVDAVVLSCEVGAVKPAPAIYAAALGALGVPAGGTVFIDDQPAFCAGARAAGIRPVRIARAGAAGRDTWPDCPVVSSLAEVPPLLEAGWQRSA